MRLHERFALICTLSGNVAMIMALVGLKAAVREVRLSGAALVHGGRLVVEQRMPRLLTRILICALGHISICSGKTEGSRHTGGSQRLARILCIVKSITCILIE